MRTAPPHITFLRSRAICSKECFQRVVKETTGEPAPTTRLPYGSKGA